MKAKLNHLTVTVIDREATSNEDKYKTVELYGKTAAVVLKALSTSQYLSTRVADVELTAKTNPTSGEVTKGYLGNVKFFDDAAGTRVEDSKERRYKIDLNRVTFTTSNKDGKEYDVSKPVYRNKETSEVTNLQDDKVPGLKTIIAAMNEESELFLHVEKTTIDNKDVFFIGEAKPLNDPSTSQNASQPRFSISVVAAGAGMMKISGPEIKDSEGLKEYIKADLGGKWNKSDKAWDAPLPEGMSVGKMFYQVIEKARELGVQPSPEASIKDVAQSAKAGASLADAAAAVTQTGASQNMKA